MMDQVKHQQLQDEAAAWIARLRSDAVSAADQQAFALWLGQDASHANAFDQMLDLWQDLGVSQYYSEPKRQALDQPMPAAATGDIKPVGHSHFTRRGLAVAASVLAVVLLSWQWTGNRGAIEPQVMQTAVGEQRTIELSDGSTLVLNTDTTVEVRMSAARRDLELQRGEAYFSVASNPERPFVVTLADARVTAIGTAFNIRQYLDHAEVTVAEGVVQVASTAGNTVEVLRAEQQIEASSEQGLGKASKTDLNKATAWQRQELVFDGTQLRDVVDELNRYSSQTIVIADSQLLGMRVSGVFQLHDPLATLEGLEASLALRRVARDGQILLYKKPL